MPLTRRLRSVSFALQGARFLVATQPNARIHLAATFAVIAAGVYFRVTRLEWIALTVAMVLVWLTEALNTAIECLGDEVSLDRRPRIKAAKDVAAFAVLTAASGAATVGLFIFAPYFLAR